MKIIVLNCGSSSIKYQLFEMPEKKVLAKGLVDKIGLKGAAIKHKRNDGTEVKIEGEILDHQKGIEYLLGILISEKYGSIKELGEIDAVGHRVVHGGEDFSGSVAITDEVIKALEKSIDLAPLHNPPNLEGIYSIKKLLPEVPQAGVFDTAFHQSMEPYAFLYALPYSLYDKYKIRRYGFHGTSHKYVSAEACRMTGADINQSKIITCHLGNGASVAAIKNGKSVDTSMGMTPTEGLIMGTRCGDIDPGVLLHIMKNEEMNAGTANTLINKHSGVLGISGISQDMRTLEEEAEQNNDHAQLALDMYHYRVKKYIGAYAAAMGGLDLLVFAGGIGENGFITREAVCEDMEFLGVELDKKINDGLKGKASIISKVNSKVKILVVPTDEEMMIAADTYEIVSGN